MSRLTIKRTCEWRMLWWVIASDYIKTWLSLLFNYRIFALKERFTNYLHTYKSSCHNVYSSCSLSIFSPKLFFNSIQLSFSLSFSSSSNQLIPNSTCFYTYLPLTICLYLHNQISYALSTPISIVWFKKHHCHILELKRLTKTTLLLKYFWSMWVFSLLLWLFQF